MLWRNIWLTPALVRSESNLGANLGPAAGRAPEACQGSACAGEVCLFFRRTQNRPCVTPRALRTPVLCACSAVSPTSLPAQTTRHLSVLRWFSLLQVRWSGVQRQRVIARCRAPGTLLLRGLDVLRGGGGPVDAADSSKPSTKAPAARSRGRGRGGFHTKQDGINVGSAAVRGLPAGRGQHMHRGAGRGAGTRGAGAHTGGTGLAGAGAGQLSPVAAPRMSAV